MRRARPIGRNLSAVFRPEHSSEVARGSSVATSRSSGGPGGAVRLRAGRRSQRHGRPAGREEQ
ncbi:hypothetical protein ACFPM0_05650 [Pseudonocardia sulfidoxydans]|uniref:hypothetical protein n=1 Tax=Pseudonocardia sulfidoxydans TaxID=54011 RepID=UPI00361322F2